MVKGHNERLTARHVLYTDKDFVEAWLTLMASPIWSQKSPRVREMHLDKLAKYPVDFATYLVIRAAAIESSFIVPDNYVDELFEAWKAHEGVFFRPPTVQEVREYCKGHNYDIDAEYFVAYYEGRGWLDSFGRPVLYWRAKILSWYFYDRWRI